MSTNRPDGPRSSTTEDGRQQTVVEFRDVTKTFHSIRGRTEALSHVNLVLLGGRMTGLVGPDGAGKTTLMRLAAALFVPDRGEVTVLGHDIRREPLAVQSSVSYMTQRSGVYQDLTVQQNLDLYADLQGLGRMERADRYEELMRMTGLAPFTGRLASKLSGGMKQKLALACSLVRPPQLLLLDEPTAGVDPVSRRELFGILGRIVSEQGATILMSTGYLDEAQRCDEVVVLHGGELLAHTPPEKILEPLEGRTFTIEITTRAERRELHRRLAARDEVLDSVVEGDRVRVVLASRGIDVEQLLGGIEGAKRAVAPRFEDGFIDLLHRRLHSDSARPAGPEGADSEDDRASPGETAEGFESGAPPPGNGQGLVAVEDLKRRFGDFYAVKGLTFEIDRGEIFGLLGPNGAGKSTAFRMLCGLLPPTEGRLRVVGVDMRRASVKARAQIGYMSQTFSLYGTLDVGENLRFFSSIYGLRGRRRRARIEWALERFQLAPWWKQPAGSLPLGYQQRLALACALMHEPELLFLDEPTSGVDPLARREFWWRITALAEQQVTVLVTTHFMEEAEYCDRLGIMYAGRFLAIGTPEDIKRPYQRAGRPAPTIRDAFIELVESQEQRET